MTGAGERRRRPHRLPTRLQTMLIYLDSNATTPVLPAVAEAMQPYLTEVYGNPASAHAAGRNARRALEDAREQIAALLGARPDEVIFTSGATEANNLALFGLAGEPHGRLLASPIEHPSVHEPLQQLLAADVQIDWLPVGPDGVVQVEALTDPPPQQAVLMLANHETGALQPVQRLSSLAPLHCDAAQAVGKLPVNFHELGVASLSLSAHKFFGPKGVGALLVRQGNKLQPRTWGGHQQQGRRPGTEAVALVVGMARALALACTEMTVRRQRVLQLRQLFWEGLRAAAPLVLNGPSDGGLPHVLNIAFPGCHADALLMSLDLAGVACSTGSACSSGSLLPSPVLQAMRVPPEVLQSAMRFSLSHLLRDEEVADAVRRIVNAVVRLRGMDDAA